MKNFKHLFVAVALVLGTGLLASCSGEGCWKISYEMTAGPLTVKDSQYIYGDSEDVDYAIAKLKDLYGEGLKITRSRVKSSEADCNIKTDK